PDRDQAWDLPVWWRHAPAAPDCRLGQRHAVVADRRRVRRRGSIPHRARAGAVRPRRAAGCRPRDRPDRRAPGPSGCASHVALGASVHRTWIRRRGCRALTRSTTSDGDARRRRRGAVVHRATRREVRGSLTMEDFSSLLGDGDFAGFENGFRNALRHADSDTVAAATRALATWLLARWDETPLPRLAELV